MTQTSTPTEPNAPKTDALPSVTNYPLLGIVGVLFGTFIASSMGRLLSVGLGDLRGGMHLGVDEASWINTAFNAGLMFIGPFSVYLGGILGARRVLLACCALLSIASALLGFSVSYPMLITLLVLAGLAAGTFYPLTLAHVLRTLPQRYALVGIAVYGMVILLATTLSTSLEAWYSNHLSWRWIFWHSAVLTPLMMSLIWFGIQRQPLPQPKEGQPAPSWRGFLYASLGLALLYAALDQGQRLDWLQSGTIVGLLVAGGILLVATASRRHLLPNPLVNYSFLIRRNTLLLGCVLIFFRFAILGTVVVIPSYLGSVRGFLPLQTGPVLLWVALPQCVCAVMAIYLLKYIDARIIVAAGFSLVGIACVMNASLSSAWSGTNFAFSQLVMAIGLSLALNGMVGAIILEVFTSGALSRPADVLTFSGYFQAVRLFGGQVGVAFLQHFLSAREQFHSNILSLHVQSGLSASRERLLGLTAGFQGQSGGLSLAAGRAGAVLGLQLRQQAFTLAIADASLLVASSNKFGFNGCFFRIAASVGVFLLLPLVLAAQQEFQIATIKPSLPGTQKHMQIRANQFATTGTTLEDLLKFAYNLHSSQLVGGPEWVRRDAFDIVADPEISRRPTQDEVKAMLGKLIIERFQLRLVRDRQELPVFALVRMTKPPTLTKAKSNREQFSPGD